MVSNGLNSFARWPDGQVSAKADTMSNLNVVSATADTRRNATSKAIHCITTGQTGIKILLVENGKSAVAD